jgi:hypothetical protein
MTKQQNKKDRARDTGLALTLILILWAIFANDLRPVIPAALTLLMSMAVPIVFSPLAPVWFGLSEAIGTVMSRVILSILFYGLLLPLGFTRRILGADPLSLKNWKSGKDSVFVNRDLKFKADDLKKPF